MSAPNQPRAASASVRLAPLAAERWDDEVDSALSGMLPRWRRNPANAGNALATLVHHPALVTAFLPLNVHPLFSSTLSPRLRDLIFTVGTYSTLATAFNTFGVQLDHDHDGNEG